MNINYGHLMTDFWCHGKRLLSPLLDNATLNDALNGNGQDALNLESVEIGSIQSGTVTPETEDTFELQIDSDTGTAYLVWNDGGTVKTLSLGDPTA